MRFSYNTFTVNHPSGMGFYKYVLHSTLFILVARFSYIGSFSQLLIIIYFFSLNPALGRHFRSSSHQLRLSERDLGRGQNYYQYGGGASKIDAICDLSLTNTRVFFTNINRQKS